VPGSAVTSISTIFPCATVKPSTEKAVPSTVQVEQLEERVEVALPSGGEEGSTTARWRLTPPLHLARWFART
jgi:hypothetical protein